LIVPNPYRNRPPAHVWKTGVAALEPRSVIPIRAKRFTIDDGAVIATAGSCFAQEIGRYLATMPGIGFLRTEPTAPDQPLFSALYGNVYTARQLVQLFDRALGHFTPADIAWRRDDGRYVDPFRPFMFRSGFATIEAVAIARAAHLEAARRVFTDCSVFVFTLGLTESWRAKADGAVFPVAPGVVVGEHTDPAGYEFHNFSYAQVVADLRGFVSRMGAVNPDARIILTVSPVPLTATCTDEHILVANAHSKAILRTACGEMDAEIDRVYYFPSYEIISGAFNKGRYYDANLRTVTRDGVDHVMAAFRQTYRDAPALTPAAANPFADTPICDEDEIVRSIGFD
jgi:hypothetical protein